MELAERLRPILVTICGAGLDQLTEQREELRINDLIFLFGNFFDRIIGFLEKSLYQLHPFLLIVNHFLGDSIFMQHAFGQPLQC